MPYPAIYQYYEATYRPLYLSTQQHTPNACTRALRKKKKTAHIHVFTRRTVFRCPVQPTCNQLVLSHLPFHSKPGLSSPESMVL